MLQILKKVSGLLCFCIKPLWSWLLRTSAGGALKHVFFYFFFSEVCLFVFFILYFSLWSWLLRKIAGGDAGTQALEYTLHGVLPVFFVFYLFIEDACHWALPRSRHVIPIFIFFTILYLIFKMHCIGSYHLLPNRIGCALCIEHRLPK